MYLCIGLAGVASLIVNLSYKNIAILLIPLNGCSIRVFWLLFPVVATVAW